MNVQTEWRRAAALDPAHAIATVSHKNTRSDSQNRTTPIISPAYASFSASC